jgi:hypothetical protein
MRLSRNSARRSRGVDPKSATPREWLDAAKHIYRVLLDDFYGDYDEEGPGITEPLEVAYGPQVAW